MIGVVLAAAISLSDLQSVNRAVNDEIKPQREAPGQDVWAINPASGDCEDYAVTKLARLADAGVPMESMSIGKVMAGRQLHAVLIVDERVLDNRYAQIGRLKDYTVLSRVSAKVALFRAKMQETK